jgi:hypothetical protein
MEGNKKRIIDYNLSSDTAVAQRNEFYSVKCEGRRFFCRLRQPDVQFGHINLYAVRADGQVHLEVVYRKGGQRKRAICRQNFDPGGRFIIRSVGNSFAYCYRYANGNCSKWFYLTIAGEFRKDRAGGIYGLVSGEIVDIRHLNGGYLMVVTEGKEFPLRIVGGSIIFCEEGRGKFRGFKQAPHEINTRREKGSAASWLPVNGVFKNAEAFF